MSEVIGVGQLSLMDLNDAIISGVPPKDPSVGSLWIDESLDPPMLKKWNGEGWIDLGELDPDLSVTIEDITETIGNMANDNVINFQERQVIKDKLTEIIGYVIADSATAMPTVATLDNSGKGGFWSVRKSARNAGIQTSDNVYDNLTTRYNNLKSYLESFTPIDAWDLRSANKDVVIEVTKATFRDRWLQYYLAVDALAEATASKLKENIDKIDINGRNFITNGGFMINLDESTWKDYYVGNVKEIVDISAETPPMRFALHVKNTANVNGGIFTPVIFEGAVAESLIGREVTLSFWLKYQNIVQGLNSTNLGRFGEIVIEGVKADNSKVYSYQRVGANNAFGSTYFSGTNMTWTKYQGTLKVGMPAGAVAIRSISFKHGLEGCKGEFWTTALKLETGNKATDWTPNPLDVEGRVTSVENKVLPDRIVQTVTSSEVYKKDIDDTKKHAETVAGAVQRDVDDLERTLDGLDREIKGTFKDGLVTESEAKAISKYINILNSEKLDVDNRYNIIYADSNLSGTPKTNLLSAKNSYNTAHNNLMKSINDAVADGRATSAESADVDSKFNSYRGALGTLSTRFEEAVRAIETAKMDSIEVGGRNLILNGNFATGDLSSWNNNGSVSYASVDGRKTAYINTGSAGIYQTAIKESGIYTFSFMAKALDNTTTARIGFLNAGTSANSIFSLSTTWTRYTYTTTSVVSANQIFHVYSQGKRYYITDIKVEKGHKATDFSPAPEDVDKAISGVQDNVDEVYRSLGSLDNEIKGTFKDGVVSEAEAKSIAKYINTLSSEKLEVDNRYSIIYADSILTGSAKTNLASAKTAYNTAHSNLITSINNAIKDGKATASESADVDSKFSSYRSALGTLSTRFEEATRFIETAKVDNVQVGSRNLLTGGDKWYITSSDHKTYVDFDTKDGITTITVNTAGAYRNAYNWLNRIMVDQTTFFQEIAEGKPYVLSLDVMVKTQGQSSFGFDTRTPDGSLYSEYAYVNDTDGKWIRVSTVLQRPPRNPQTTSLFLIRMDDFAVGDFVKVRNFKLERGNKATDWTPAPEDVDSAIGEKVSTTVYNKKIGEVETALGKVTITAGQTEKAVNDLSGEVDTIDTTLSKLVIDTGKISSTVSEVKTTADTAKRDIDNLEIGGKNLLRDTALVHEGLGKWSNLPTIKSDDIYPYVEMNYGWGLRQVIPFMPKGIYTISVLAKEGTNPSSRVRFSMSDVNGVVSKVLTDDWDVYSYTFTLNSNVEDFSIYFLNSHSGTGNANIKFTKFMLEKGSRATDWTPAPEDISDELGEKASTEDVATALQTVSEEYSTAIDDATSALSETIAQDIEDMESSITTAYSTAIEQTAKDINISIGKVDERIDGTQQEITEVKSFFTFSDDGFTIGRSDSPLSINISNTRMEFRDSGTAVAYIDKQTMYIENIHTLQSFIVGNHKIEKHDNNITIIKWIG